MHCCFCLILFLAGWLKSGQWTALHSLSYMRWFCMEKPIWAPEADNVVLNLGSDLFLLGKLEAFWTSVYSSSHNKDWRHDSMSTSRQLASRCPAFVLYFHFLSSQGSESSVFPWAGINYRGRPSPPLSHLSYRQRRESYPSQISPV